MCSNWNATSHRHGTLVIFISKVYLINIPKEVSHYSKFLKLCACELIFILPCNSYAPAIFWCRIKITSQFKETCSRWRHCLIWEIFANLSKIFQWVNLLWCAIVTFSINTFKKYAWMMHWKNSDKANLLVLIIIDNWIIFQLFTRILFTRHSFDYAVM